MIDEPQQSYEIWAIITRTVNGEANPTGHPEPRTYSDLLGQMVENDLECHGYAIVPAAELAQLGRVVIKAKRAQQTQRWFERARNTPRRWR